MSCLHVAGLALFGWSLIGPPPLQNSWWSPYWHWSTTDEWNVAAPLSRWIARDTFETSESCQKALAEMREQNADYLPSSIRAWQCVAADDRRLTN